MYSISLDLTDVRIQQDAYSDVYTAYNEIYWNYYLKFGLYLANPRLYVLRFFNASNVKLKFQTSDFKTAHFHFQNCPTFIEFCKKCQIVHAKIGRDWNPVIWNFISMRWFQLSCVPFV